MRVRYAKRGRLRFTSHRDFSRAFERAVFRARLPMAYSSGFNPHPRISYAGAAPTGAASEAEYLELALAEVVDPGRLLAELDAVMPDGLDVLGGGGRRERAGQQPLRAAREQPLVGRSARPTRSSTPRAAAAFLAADEVLVQRMTKKGLREFDCRAAVVTLAAEPPGERHPALAGAAARRPGGAARRRRDRHRAGRRHLAPGGPPLLTRTAQGPLDEATATVGDPLV